MSGRGSRHNILSAGPNAPSQLGEEGGDDLDLFLRQKVQFGADESSTGGGTFATREEKQWDDDQHCDDDCSNLVTFNPVYCCCFCCCFLECSLFFYIFMQNFELLGRSILTLNFSEIMGINRELCVR